MKPTMIRVATRRIDQLVCHHRSVTVPIALSRVLRLSGMVPLVVTQIVLGIALGSSLLGRVAPEVYEMVFNPAMVVRSPPRDVGAEQGPHGGGRADNCSSRASSRSPLSRP